MASQPIIACSVDSHARIQRVTVSSLFVPRAVILTMTKQALLVFGGDVKFDADGEPIFPEGADEWIRYVKKAYLPKVLRSTAKDLTTKVAHARLAQLVYDGTKRRTAKKLLKGTLVCYTLTFKEISICLDPVSSAKRKAERQSRLEASMGTTLTIVRASALLYVAIASVDIVEQSAILLYRLWNKRYESVRFCGRCSVHKLNGMATCFVCRAHAAPRSQCDSPV